MVICDGQETGGHIHSGLGGRVRAIRNHNRNGLGPTRNEVRKCKFQASAFEVGCGDWRSHVRHQIALQEQLDHITFFHRSRDARQIHTNLRIGNIGDPVGGIRTGIVVRGEGDVDHLLTTGHHIQERSDGLYGLRKFGRR